MSSLSYPREAQGAGRVRIYLGPKQKRPEEKAGDTKVTLEDKEAESSSIASTTTTTTTTTQTATTELSPPTRDTSMEALNVSGYIVVVLVLVVGALVGVLATVSHHLHHRPASISILHHHHHHHRHHHHREETLTSNQRRLLLEDHYRHPATPMLSVSPGMEVGSGGHGGLGGGLEGGPAGGGGGGGGDGMQEAMVAAARDRAVRAGSVRQDLALDLPPRLQLPDGEERPYGAHTALHLRDPEQESEIYQKCVRPPPNRTVFDSESPPPYRSQSALLDAPDRIVRCHSAGSSLLRVFRKFPNPGNTTTTMTTTTTTTTTPTVVVPQQRRPTLSNYSESSSNLSNLSSLTVVPCEADETQQQQHV
ncbi:histone-lysine N-methyltransferase Suv4-20-like [Leptopilina boulardi]|uniref:histone-lysine N-methyltransferase Suv4-20-like n=1 Tax=Leptopilina boulardi TaxID=63433 RepID=UPI0021F64626|nr:histone-lysine N-methyltransferase Suv4-20-like [Leptopilina boulardi]